jgi:hypothetical protein
MIYRKPHMASSICLRATIFQNPEGTLWSHGTILVLSNVECSYACLIAYTPIFMRMRTCSSE